MSRGNGNGNKSVTIRLDEPDLYEWAASQSSATASIRTAIKICILQFGKNADLLDSIISDRFGNGSSNELFRPRPMKEENHEKEPALPPKQPDPAIPQPGPAQPVPMQTPPVNPNPTGFPDMSNMGPDMQVDASLSSLL